MRSGKGAWTSARENDHASIAAAERARSDCRHYGYCDYGYGPPPYYYGHPRYDYRYYPY